MSQDYYKILGVSRGSSTEEVQKAYRKLARKYHPDLHADKDEQDKERAKQKFQEIQNAYDVLSDDKKRQLYDQLGPNFDQMGGRNPFQEYAAQAGGTPFGNMDIDLGQIFGGGQAKPGGFEDFLRQFGFGPQMGGGAGPMPGGDPTGGFGHRPPQPTKGRSHEETVTIPFATAVLGGQYQMSMQRGNGKVENILVTIPAGIEHGKKIRLRGQGQPSPNGGPDGDLLINVMVASHPSFSRRGIHLHVKVPITLAEAALGAKIDLPSPHGVLSITIPKRSSSGSTLRLKGMGIQTANGAKGDMIVTLEIKLPEEISEEDLELIQQLDHRWENHNPRSSLQW